MFTVVEVSKGVHKLVIIRGYEYPKLVAADEQRVKRYYRWNLANPNNSTLRGSKLVDQGSLGYVASRKMVLLKFTP